MRAKLLFLLAFAVVVPFSPRIHALALSGVELQSHLNQPLSARIRLSGVEEGDLGELNITVNEIVDEVAAARHTILNHEVVKEGANYFLVISSRDAIREPVLSFVVELSWSAGHLQRNYALIIDPQ